MEEYLQTFVPLMKRSKGFDELKSEVIDQDLCSGCGNCSAFCQHIDLDENSTPYLIGECTLKTGSIKCSIEGTCYDACPMVDYDFKKLEEKIFGKVGEEWLGNYIKIVAAKSEDERVLKRCQDGGVATSLLIASIENNYVNAVTVVNGWKYWKESVRVTNDINEIINSAGTKYLRCSTPNALGKNLKYFRRIAMIGTGCQISGMRKFMEESGLKLLIEKTKESETPVDIYLIGLFCYENFPKGKFEETIRERYNITLNDIEKMDIKRGVVYIYTRDGKEIKEKVSKALGKIAPSSCKLCKDFTARLSDISLGSVGSKDGYTTVIIRTKKGLELFEKAVEKGYLEVIEDINKEEIIKTATSKLKYYNKEIERRKSLGLRIINNW